MVFEPIDARDRAAITRHLDEAVLFFEPRITLERSWSDRGLFRGRLTILAYTVRATNTRNNVVFRSTSRGHPALRASTIVW